MREIRGVVRGSSEVVACLGNIISRALIVFLLPQSSSSCTLIINIAFLAQSRHGVSCESLLNPPSGRTIFIFRLSIYKWIPPYRSPVDTSRFHFIFYFLFYLMKYPLTPRRPMFAIRRNRAGRVPRSITSGISCESLLSPSSGHTIFIFRRSICK